MMNRYYVIKVLRNLAHSVMDQVDTDMTLSQFMAIKFDLHSRHIGLDHPYEIAGTHKYHQAIVAGVLAIVDLAKREELEPDYALKGLYVYSRDDLSDDDKGLIRDVMSTLLFDFGLLIDFTSESEFVLSALEPTSFRT